MALRVPDANDLDTFWSNLLSGHEGIRHFKPEELDASVPESLRSQPNFVAARGVLEGADTFDAGFFGLTERESVLLDPQQRLLLELSWSALEHAGLDPSTPDLRIGAYLGTANNTYAAALRQAQPELIEQSGEFAAMLASEKDYAATRVAHRLNLRGPAVSVHTACSTGLVAVAQAWHALASGQCDMALAGGATVMVPQASGYLHVEGGMESSDGRCRPFDASANGTVFSSAGAVVVLKPLDRALAEGDTIYAVIKGVGLNNDGGDKASFTAPSVSGQAEAIRMALDHAGVNARSIGYVEAHGTGTSLGDPIEMAALTRAWRQDTPDHQFCTLGSVKGHVGHTVAAAGVVGLVKAALALYRREIPGTLHFEQANPQLDLPNTPFKVSAQRSEWPAGLEPRRAAVSAFGVGGTNAHVILEEAPSATAVPPALQQPAWVLPLSARSEQAARDRALALADHLIRQPEQPMAEVVATLTRGRQPMPYRLSVVAQTADEAIKLLRQPRPISIARKQPRLVFLFPGQGSQHPGMARQLFEQVPAFREALQACLDHLQLRLDVDLKFWLTEADPGDHHIAQSLAQTQYAQPALFSMSYALAAWLESLGVRPDAMIGHSIGELAAACRSGVMSLHDALDTVWARGQAMSHQPKGAMLAVHATSQDLTLRLNPGTQIAGFNAPNLSVASGSHAGIDELAAQLEVAGISCSRLKVSHGFHSALMEGALPMVRQALLSKVLKPPQGVVYSCVTGAPLQADQATHPDYWAQQVRAPVCFTQAVQAEMAHGAAVWLEVGPGQSLTALLRQHRTPAGESLHTVAMLGPAAHPADPVQNAMQALGALWCAGVEVAWPIPRSARRAVLPTYPFQRSRYWFAKHTAAKATKASTELPNTTLGSQDPIVSRRPLIEQALRKALHDVSGIPINEMFINVSLLEQGLDSLLLTQATLEIERVFGVRFRLRRLMEDLDTVAKLGQFLDEQLPADRFAPSIPAPLVPPNTAMPTALPPHSELMVGPEAVRQLIQQQLQVVSQQLAVLGLQPAPSSMSAAEMPGAQPVVVPPTAPAGLVDPTPPQSLVPQPFGASPQLTLRSDAQLAPAQRQWLDDFVVRYNRRTAKSKAYSQAHRARMADPRVVTGFNPLWKDLVYPIVADRSEGSRVWDLDGNEYIDLLSCFGANLLGYQPPRVVEALHEQLDRGLEVGPQHPLAAEVSELICEFTGMERVAFCNTGSEAVMGAMRIARTVTGRKTIAIITNSYHGIFDEVIVRGSKQLRSLSAAPGILTNAVENMLVLDYASEESLQVLRSRGKELAAIMIEPIQNKRPSLQPHAFVRSLREIADQSGCALIFDEVVTGFRLGTGGAQAFYGVKADIATYGKIIGGGLPLAVIAGSSRWLDALDGGHWQFGDASYPEAGVTYFAGTFVRHPLALAAARATLLHIKDQGPALYTNLNNHTQRLVDELNQAFSERGAPVKAVHCASLWRLAWDDNLPNVSLFYYLARFHGLHLYEQFGHFVTQAITVADTQRIVSVFVNGLDELMRLGFIRPRPGGPGGSGLPRPESLLSCQGSNATCSLALKPDGVVASPRHGSSHDLLSRLDSGLDSGAIKRHLSPDTTPVPPLAMAPLSPGQTERWLAANFDPAARLALNESFCISLRGEVRQQALLDSLNAVIERHEAFRIGFDREEPMQTLHANAKLHVNQIDLRHETDADLALERFCAEASVRAFELDAPPLADVSVLSLADGRVVVHVVASHLIFDGWASSVFNAELATAYRAHAAGQLPIWTKADSALAFSAAQAKAIQGPEGVEALRFWQQALEYPPRPLSLGDRVPGPVRSYAAATQRMTIDQALLSRLREQAKRNASTLFQLLLSAVTALLHQRSGQPDFVICIPFAGQSLGRNGPLLADGVLDLPLRMRSEPGDTGLTLLRRVRSRLLDALEHPWVTQGTVARAIGLRSRGNRPALSGVFFNLDPRVDLSAFAPLQAKLHEPCKQGTLHELFFNFYEHDELLSLDLHHSTEFVSPVCARSLLDELQTFLRSLASSMDTALSSILEIAPSESSSPASLPFPVDARLLGWNATDKPLAEDARLEQWIAHQAQAHGSSVAIIAKTESVTYGQMMIRAHRFAHALRHRGVGPGQLVGVCMGSSADLIPVLLGVWQTGAAYLPLDPNFPQERLRYMAEDACISLIVTESKHAYLVGLPRSQQLRLDDDAAEISAAAATPLPLIQGPSHEAPAYVIYTSGSTGQPKGVVLPQRAVCNFIASMCREPGLQAADRLLAVTTLSFDIAVLELFAPLTVGAQVVLAQCEDTTDGQALADLIKTHAITVMQATPTTWQLMLEAGWQAPKTLRMLCGGEPMLPPLAQSLLQSGGQLWNMYGPTETTVWSTLAHITSAEHPVTIGRPIDNTQAWVLDERMRPVAIGQEGELWLGGWGVALGYLNRPQLTQKRFRIDPFKPHDPKARLYRTGDLARWREDGTIDYLGRLDHQVKIRGHRIELGEIESVLARAPGVACNVVMSIQDGPLNVRLVAYVVPTAGATLNESDLKDALKRQLPDYMRPHHWVVLSALPLLPNGKIDRKALPSLLQKTKLVKPSQDPLNDAQRTVARAMCDVLNTESIGLDDDFFSLGGDSLLAARLIGKLNRELGQQFTPRTLFEAPTVALLTQRVGGPLLDDTVICLRRGGARKPIFFIHDGDGDTLLYRRLANALNSEQPIYALAPHRSDGFAMLHTRVSEITAFQLKKIRSIQAHGPYFLSGLCSGGVIAFEIACLLQAQGESVAMLALLDAADGQAQPRTRHVSRRRMSRFTAGIKTVLTPGSGLSSTKFIGNTLIKVINLMTYEAQSLWHKLRTLAFVSLLRWHLDRGRQPPAFLRQLSVREIYAYAEMSHSHISIFSGTLHLFRATQSDGTPADETFLEAYSDPLFGWGRRVSGEIVATNIPGGHSSILQPPHVDTLALAFQECIDQSQEPYRNGQPRLGIAA